MKIFLLPLFGATAILAAAATPSAAMASIIPAAPQQLVVSESGDRLVAVRWSAVPGVSHYTVWRSTLHPDGLGGFYPIGTKRIATVGATTFIDRSPSSGRVYEYHVTSENAAGQSEASAKVQASPVPAAPSVAPAELSASWKDFRGGVGIVLTWKAVPGATGYVIYRSTATNPSFVWPADFRTALLETTWFDQGNTDKKAKVKGLDPTQDYAFQISAVNAGGVSPPTTVRVRAKNKP